MDIVPLEDDMDIDEVWEDAQGPPVDPPQDFGDFAVAGLHTPVGEYIVAPVPQQVHAHCATKSHYEFRGYLYKCTRYCDGSRYYNCQDKQCKVKARYNFARGSFFLNAAHNHPADQHIIAADEMYHRIIMRRAQDRRTGSKRIFDEIRAQ